MRRVVSLVAWMLAACAGVAACGGHPPTPVPVPRIDVPGETARAVALIDDQVRFADNGLYNRFRWMSDGTYCYTEQSRAEILKYCFAPGEIDAAAVAARPAGAIGAPYDRVMLTCRRKACVKRSSQLTSMFGPRDFRQETGLTMVTRRGGGAATADAVRRLVALSAMAR